MAVKHLSLKEIGIKRLIIVFLAGAALIFFSVSDLFTASTKEGSNNKADEEVQAKGEINEQKIDYYDYYNKRLKEVLCCIKGIGDAEVMITYQDKGELHVLKDNPKSSETLSEADSDGGLRNSSSETIQEATVFLEGTGNERTPYVIKESIPKVNGVLIVAKGVSDSKVCLKIIEAVEALFDVPAHKIQIMEMK